MADNPDYICVEHTVHPQRFIVVIRSWMYADQDYAIKKCAGPFKRVAADALAQSWAAALHLEIR